MVSAEQAPLTQTTVASTVAGTGRVRMTRRMRLRSSAFCCAAVRRPLVHNAGRRGPRSRSCARSAGSSVTAGAAWATRSAASRDRREGAQGLLPAPLQLRRDQPVVGVDQVVDTNGWCPRQG